MWTNSFGDITYHVAYYIQLTITGYRHTFADRAASWLPQEFGYPYSRYGCRRTTRCITGVWYGKPTTTPTVGGTVIRNIRLTG
jgi:hypothetical protein